jgi:hypothetical protein
LLPRNIAPGGGAGPHRGVLGQCRHGVFKGACASDSECGKRAGGVAKRRNISKSGMLGADDGRPGQPLGDLIERPSIEKPLPK